MPSIRNLPAGGWSAKSLESIIDSSGREALASRRTYEYALYHPNVVEWMPCYCGCVGMGHRSNLDCYLKPDMVNGKTQFEEHASYCDVCVKTTLLTKQMIGQSKSLREIRAAVDSTFGGDVPGTNTALPPE